MFETTFIAPIIEDHYIDEITQKAMENLTIQVREAVMELSNV